MQDTPPMRGDVPERSAPIQERALAEKIRLLEEDRQRHAQAIAEIDQVLERVNQALALLQGRPRAAPLTPSAPPPGGSEARPRRRYQKLSQTGEESVIAFIRQHGNPCTAEINEHWRREGRPGVANPTVARLLKRGLLRRENDPDVRGSRYRVVD